VSWTFGFAAQIDRLCFVGLFPEQVLEPRISVAAGFVDLMFAAAGDEADRALVRLEVPNESPGDAFLGQPVGFLLARANLNDGRPQALNPCRSCRQGILLEIH